AEGVRGENGAEGAAGRPGLAPALPRRLSRGAGAPAVHRHPRLARSWSRSASVRRLRVADRSVAVTEGRWDEINRPSERVAPTCQSSLRNLAHDRSPSQRYIAGLLSSCPSGTTPPRDSPAPLPHAQEEGVLQAVVGADAGDAALV